MLGKLHARRFGMIAGERAQSLRDARIGNAFAAADPLADEGLSASSSSTRAGSVLAPWLLMDKLTVKRFMTPSPHTIGHDQPLTAAHEVMRKHDIRHLPVLDGGRLAGILSQRDLYLIESLKDVDPNQVSVSEAMSSEVFAVDPDTTIRKIVGEMAVHKYGSAVVVEGGKVVGVFTTTDALGVCVGALDPALDRGPTAHAPRKSRVKSS